MMVQNLAEKAGSVTAAHVGGLWTPLNWSAPTLGNLFRSWETRDIQYTSMSQIFDYSMMTMLTQEQKKTLRLSIFSPTKPLPIWTHRSSSPPTELKGGIKGLLYPLRTPFMCWIVKENADRSFNILKGILNGADELHLRGGDNVATLVFVFTQFFESKWAASNDTCLIKPYGLKMTSSRSPTEDQLKNVLVALRKDNPTLGIPKLHALLRSNRPEWTISEKRTRKILQGEGLVLNTPAQKSTTASDSQPEGLHPTSSLIEGLDIEKWTPKVEVKYFDQTKGKGLVAKNHIAEGEILWKEDPFILAPEWLVSFLCEPP